jgi:hypothetical protein
MKNIFSLVIFLILTKAVLAGTDIHFYTYNSGRVEKFSTPMNLKGNEDPWSLKVIDEFVYENSRGGASDDELVMPIAVTRTAAKELIPKPDETLYSFVYSETNSKTVMLGATKPKSFSWGTGDSFGITFRVDSAPLRAKSSELKEFSDYLEGRDKESQWLDWEFWELVFVSVPAATKKSLLPKPIVVPTTKSDPLVARIKKRLKRAGVEGGYVGVEVTFQALGEKYLVVHIRHDWDNGREIYQMTPNGFRLVHRNSINNAEED